MRRSLAPSQRSKLVESNPSDVSNQGSSTDGLVTIQRLPLFGFLEIPKALTRQFKIPSGCVLTEKSLELRKTKRLGPPKNFHIVRPGDYANALVKHTGSSPDESGENEEEDLPTASTNLPPFEPLVLWSHPEDPDNKVEVIPQLACKLRPHQREGVQFLFECTMGLRGFEGEGCILADDMGLGKTLMSITLLWTLLNQGFSNSPGSSAVRKIVVVCPTSLVGNWDNEIRKWVGEHCPTFAVKTDPKKMIKTFLQHRGKGVLIVSYETQRLYSKLFESAAKPSILNKAPGTGTGTGTGAVSSEACDVGDAAVVHGPGVEVTTTDPVRLLRAHSNNGVCDLLICDEAHKLKNADSGLAKSLNLLPARKRILLSGTPMQNELTEFFNMVNFCNPAVLGTNAEFKRRYERPILASREPDATEKQTADAARLQKELSTIVNEFILKRGNILNAQHLPPKLVQFVCCRLTPLQETLYNHLLSSKEIRHAREGKQLDTLGVIRQLINICSHPKLLLDTYAAKRACNEPVSEELVELVNIIRSHSPQQLQQSSSSGGGGLSGVKPTLAGGLTRMGTSNPGRLAEMRNFSLKKGLGPSSGGGSAADRVDPELSGKMAVLCRMMQTMRASKQGERIVVVSNYTQTLDLIQQVCVQSNWPVLRLDGSISANKRTKLVDDFNNPGSGAFVFLLSSKAGGCGINLIGGSRLVLFDPDWNPASDKQAAARIWREGQKRRCFIYRFMSTGSIEEKIIQRQLSKEGLADIVDDKEQVNQFSSDELRDLFSLRQDTASDTHDTLRCKRCSSVKVREASKKGGKAATLTAAQADGCAQFLDAFVLHLQQEAATHIAKQLKSGTPPAQIPSGINPASPETITLPFAGEIEALKETLHSGGFASLPVYSKAQREVMQAIDDTLQQARQHKPPVADVAVTAPEADGGTADGGGNGGGGAVQSEEDKAEAAMIALYMLLFPNSFSIFGEFLNRWVEAVPGLTLLAKASKSTSSGNLAGAAAAATDGDGDAADEALEGEFVEQEGCPDDTDFNRWSHHCGVTSCDDELLSRALADDNTVSFVFGLEVNWSLLESREAALREENELRKEQQRLDLEALNEQRRLQREGKLVAKKPTNKGDDGSGSDSDGGDRGNGSAAKPEPSSKKAPKKAPAEKKRKRSSEGADAEGSADAVTHPTKKAAKAAPKDSSPEGGKRSSTHLSPAAVASAAAAASAPAPVVTTSRRTAQIALVNPLKEIDETFRADWEYLRRTHAKGKLDLAVFPAVLKQLKQFNNNWRVVPGDYSRSAPGEVMWTRLPGLKAETCANYRAGFDYFVNEAQLRKFICAQATLLGDSALAAPLSAEEVSVSAAVKEAAPRPTFPASTSSSAKVSAAVTSKRGRIQSDSESGSDVEEDEVAIVASVKKAKVTVEDINFSDSSDESIVGDRGGSSRKASPGTVAGAAAVTAMVRPPNRRVIADDDDEEENKAEAKEEEAKVLVPVAPAAPRPHQAAKPPTATSVSATTRKATPAKTPKKPTAAAAATSGSASSSAVFDLTTPTPPTPKAVSISASKPQPLRGSNQKENAPPNAADSHGPSVSKSSLSSSSGGGGLLSKARSSSSAAAAVREKEEKDEEVQDWNTQRTADSQDSQQHSQEDDDDDVAHSLGAKSRNESGNISSGGNGNRNGSRSSSSQQSGDYGGASASTSASASATVWSCVACTLENETAKNPTECALCETRRSFNPRPKRAAAVSSQLSQLM